MAPVTELVLTRILPSLQVSILGCYALHCVPTVPQLRYLYWMYGRESFMRYAVDNWLYLYLKPMVRSRQGVSGSF